MISSLFWLNPTYICIFLITGIIALSLPTPPFSNFQLNPTTTNIASLSIPMLTKALHLLSTWLPLSTITFQLPQIANNMATQLPQIANNLATLSKHTPNTTNSKKPGYPYQQTHSNYHIYVANNLATLINNHTPTKTNN